MKKGDIIIISVVLVLALIRGLIYYVGLDTDEEGAILVIEVSGVEVARKPLIEKGRDVIETYYGPAGETVVQYFERGARVLTSDCPDKVCINYGMMDRPGHTNACLPNRVVFRIIGGNDDTDINLR